jgi:hypothetical protein
MPWLLQMLPRHLFLPDWQPRYTPCAGWATNKNPKHAWLSVLRISCRRRGRFAPNCLRPAVWAGTIRAPPFRRTVPCRRKYSCQNAGTYRTAGPANDATDAATNAGRPGTGQGRSVTRKGPRRAPPPGRPGLIKTVFDAYAVFSPPARHLLGRFLVSICSGFPVLW